MREEQKDTHFSDIKVNNYNYINIDDRTQNGSDVKVNQFIEHNRFPSPSQIDQALLDTQFNEPFQKDYKLPDSGPFKPPFFKIA